MLSKQNRSAIFSGGLESKLIDNWFIEKLKAARINQLFLAADTVGALGSLRSVVEKLTFLGRDKLRCYVMIGRNESLDQATARLQAVWDIGCLPFSQLFQPPDKYIDYSLEWRDLNRTWSRPATTKALCK